MSRRRCKRSTRRINRVPDEDGTDADFARAISTVCALPESPLGLIYAPYIALYMTSTPAVGTLRTLRAQCSAALDQRLDQMLEHALYQTDIVYV